VYQKPQISFYRKLLIAYLIDTGTNTVPKIESCTGMYTRTIQDSLKSLSNIDIKCIANGARKTGFYSIEDWGPIRREYVVNNLEHICEVVGIKHICAV